jgi:UDP-2,3-diacylglucosamine pyrophosphatase LpxH
MAAVICTALSPLRPPLVMPASARYRSIWISDVHLGIAASRADFLLDFLAHHDADHLYLVGDIFDGWALRRSWHWPANHNEVIQALLGKAKAGTEITYVPGNHDAFARAYPGLRLGGVTVRREATHTTADGRRFLVVHGDEFDGVVKFAPWLSKLGAVAYTSLIGLSTLVHRVRRWMGRPYWSLSAYVKYKTKQAVQFIASFEEAVAAKARAKDADGIVCGHIHHAELRTIGGVVYANCGDWVESCTALVEHDDGRLEVVRWVPSPGAEVEVGTSVAAEALHGDSHATLAPPVLQQLAGLADG